MGFFNGTISGIARFKIQGDGWQPNNQFDEQIKTGAFRSIFPENSETNIGFVNINDCLDSDFTPEKTLLGDYRVMSLRIDRRSVPPSSLRIRVLEDTKKKMEETGQKRLYREQREAIREAARLDLLKNIPPVTAIYDIAVNTVSGTVYVSSLTTKVLQAVQDAFKGAFKLTIIPLIPVRVEDLDLAGMSTWTVGREFLTWLWFRSYRQDGKISLGGDAVATVTFTRRLALESGEGEYTETVVCSGNNAELQEAKEALRQGKKIKEARIRVGKEEMSWEFGYKGDSFQFQSVKLPLTAGQEEDETPEGRNLDRLFLMGTLVDTVDDIFKVFFRLRTSLEWPDEISAMLAWVEEQ